ncbi:hypothetical protein H6F95_08890 [Cyanobacteria bacterium FACHB-471]|nr:hypothetical protein [Cyanobacteria bacterium FACHB-471]
MNKLLTIAASFVLSLIAGLNAALMAKEQSPNFQVQFDSSQLQPVTLSELPSDPQPDLQTEQSTTPNPPSPCLACGMG